MDCSKYKGAERLTLEGETVPAENVPSQAGSPRSRASDASSVHKSVSSSERQHMKTRQFWKTRCKRNRQTKDEKRREKRIV